MKGFKVLFFVMFCSSALFSEPAGKEGKITDVILYRNQALVNRVIEVDLKEGAHEVIVTKLPSQIIQSSMYAEAIGAEVRAARVRVVETKEEADPRVVELDEKLEKLGIAAIRINKLLELNKQKFGFLTKQEDFVATTEKTELNKGILQPGVMKELTLFNFEQKKEIANEELELQSELRNLQKEKDLVVRERKQLAKSSLRNMEASIFIDKPTSGKCEIKLYYIVQNSGWSPIYNFYSKLGSKTVKVEFNARIQQVSGENWDNVNLTLSNATPALSAVAPGLSPFRVSLSSGVNYQLDDLKTVTQGVAKKMNEAQQKSLGAQSWKENQDSSWAMNSAANEYQNLELVARDEDLNALKKDSKSESSSPSVSFNLKSKVSLPSKTDQQLIKVERLELPAKFYNVSIPLLTTYVYREAEIENDAIENLLEGQVSSYLDDRFVGKGEISNIARGQNFVMGFGIDSQIRARRDLFDKKEKILGGNKELTFKVRIVLENYYKKNIDLKILDRIPVEDEKENIRITLDLKGNALSLDELYNQTERAKGILRWDASVPGDSSGSKAKVLEYNYKMELDKNLQIAFPSAQKNDQMKTEFEAMQKMRYNK